MALVLQDRVRESSSTVGTGSVTLTGPYLGYRTFASCIPNGSVVYYTIQNTADGYEGEWEVGYGTYTSGTNSMSRDTVYSSSNGGSKVPFSAGARLSVFITQPAETAVYRETDGTIIVGTWQSTPVAVTYGGTGSTTKTAGFNALSPVTAKGDLITSDGTNNVNLPVGTNTYVLTADSTQPSGIKWAAPSSGGGTTTNSVTFNDSGLGAASGVSFNGSTAYTISSNTVGAPSKGGTGAIGVWNIGISGNAATATSALEAGTAQFSEKCDVVEDHETSQDCYIIWTVAPEGNYNQLSVTTTKLRFNPVTGLVTIANNLSVGGTISSTGTITVSSDERLKTNWRPLQNNFVSQLADIKSGIYDRVDIGEAQVGVSAQSLQGLMPEAVIENDKGFLSVAYGNAALTAAVELAKEVVKLREELEALKAKTGV